MIRLTRKQFEALKKRGHTNHSVRGAIYSGYADANFEQAYDNAVQTLRDLDLLGKVNCLGGDLKLSVIVEGKSRADRSNIFKGIEDAMQGILFENDRQIKEGHFTSED